MEVINSEEVAIITLDYKMKFEPKKYRQKSSEWYGRKGISWHGTVVTYMQKRLSSSSTETGKNGVETTNLYLDYVCGNEGS